MPVVIPDETLQAAGLTEREAVVEIACRLYDAGKLALWPAAKLAGLSRSEFESELMSRKIPVYRPTEQDVADDLAALERLRGGGRVTLKPTSDSMNNEPVSRSESCARQKDEPLDPTIERLRMSPIIV